MTWHYIEKWLISALCFVQVEHWTLQLRAWPVWGTLREGEGDVMQTSSQKKGLFNAPKMDWLLLLSSLAFTWTFFYHLPQWTNYFYYYGITFSFTLFFAGNAFLCILAVPNGPSGNLQRNKKTHLHYNSMWNVYTCISHRAKLIWEWFSSLANPGAIVLSSWQDSLHHQLNGFSPNSGPQKKPLALLQAYLSCGQHTWTFYVGQKNSDKMLSSGRGRELLSFPGPCIPALPPSSLYIPLPSASVWPVMLLPFFYNSKKHNKVTKRTRLWVLLYEILGFRGPD